MSRRKPALRIGGGGVVNRHTFYDEDSSSKKGGLGLLGAYGDSDTDDIAGHRQEHCQDQPQNATTLDSKVADFLKEIDELESDSKSSEPAETEPPQISWGDWTQCMDEKTQHPYYWNTTTNEVTWMLPEEISVQLQKIQQHSSTQTAEKETKAHEEQATQASRGSSNDKQNSQDSKAAEPMPKSILKCSSVSDTKSNDIDVDTELENALKSHAGEQSLSISDTDLELELLRLGSLPLSNAEEEDMLERFEPEVLKLEEEEEKRRAAGTWDRYEEEIEKRKNIIMSDKMKWRAERMVILLKMRPKDEKDSPGGIFETNEDERKEDINNDMVLSPVASTVIDEGKSRLTTQDESTKRSSNAKSPKARSGVRGDTSSSVGVQCCLSEEAKPDSENTEMKSQITELSDIISGKLSYLEVSRRAMTDFHVLLIEMETRMKDWKEKALSDLYLKERLQEAAQKLKSYEESATPAGWSCHWDSAAKRYFYKNNDTGQLQWQYPIVQIKSADKAKEESAAQDVEKKKKRKVDLLKDSEDRTKRSRSESPVRSTRETLVGTKAENNAVSTNSSPSQSSSVNNQAAETSTTQTPLAYMATGQYPYAGYHGQGYMGYNAYQQYSQHMQSMFPTPDSMPPPPGEESANFLGETPPPLPSEQPPPLPSPPSDPAADGETGADDDGIVMEMSEGEISDGDDASAESKTAVMSQSAIIYKPPEVAQYTNQAAMVGAPISAMATLSSQSNVAASGVPHPSLNKQGKVTKTKKVRKTKKSTAAKKPPKEMTSLVAQWQKAKYQMEEETRRLEEEDEEEEDQASLAKKQIEKWKQEQISSGKALMNANFEPVPDDWRSRVLKKKSKS